MATTPNLGLKKYGANGWREDGTCAAYHDANCDVIENTVIEIQNNITEVQENIQNIVIEGGGDASFTFVQTVASATWIVQHNLGKFPAVTVVDSSGHEVVGDISHSNPNSLTIFFSAPFAGSAYLN